MHRKITRYERQQKYKARDIVNGDWRFGTEIKRCSESEADTKIEEYADCYGKECPAYKNGECLKSRHALDGLPHQIRFDDKQANHQQAKAFWDFKDDRKPCCYNCAKVPYRESNANMLNYCSNCGAKMRGGVY